MNFKLPKQSAPSPSSFCSLMSFNINDESFSLGESFFTYLANARLVIGVNAHVVFKGCLEVKFLVTDFARLCVLLVMSPDMNLQIMFRCNIQCLVPRVKSYKL